MRESTMVWLGIRHVGRKDQPDAVTQQNVKQTILLIAKELASNDMATRFEFIIGRDQEEVERQFRREIKKHQAVTQSIEEELADLWKDFE